MKLPLCILEAKGTSLEGSQIAVEVIKKVLWISFERNSLYLHCSLIKKVLGFYNKRLSFYLQSRQVTNFKSIISPARDSIVR